LNVEIICRYLASKSYRFKICFDGPSALKILEENNKPDLILLDVMMPGMSGYEVCRKIRKTYPPEKLPILFLTAKNRITDLVQGFEAGGNDYLSKPFYKEELFSRIGTHLNLLEAKGQMQSLHQLSNRIAQFDQIDRFPIFLKQELRRLPLAPCFVFFQNQQPVLVEGEANISLLEFPCSLIKSSGYEMVVCNDIQPQTPLHSFYGDEIIGGHFVSIFLTQQQHLLCLYRNKREEPFLDMDILYLENFARQLNSLDTQIKSLVIRTKMMCFQEIQPFLDQTLYLFYEHPYSVIVFASGEEKTIRASLNYMDRFYEDYLVRISGMHLINPQQISHINQKPHNGRSQYEVIMKHPTTPLIFPITRTYLAQVKSRIPHHFPS